MGDHSADPTGSGGESRTTATPSRLNACTKPVPSIEWELPVGTRGLIFDCDGTLADTMPIHFLAWKSMLEPHGLTLPEAQFYAFAGMPSLRIVEVLATEQDVHLVMDEIIAMVEDKEALYVAKLSDVKAVPAVFAIADRYRGELPMAVASGGDGWVVRRTLTAIGALDWFDAIVGAEDTQRHKPEPDVFLEAARRIGVLPATCVVFEDSDLGLLAAERAGMLGVDIRSWT